MSELQQTDAWLRGVIETAVDGILIIDSEGRIRLFNRAAELLFGYAADEVLGRNVTLLMPPPFADEHDGYLKRYLSTREPRIIGIGRDVQGRRADGSTFPMHLSVGEIRHEPQAAGMPTAFQLAGAPVDVRGWPPGTLPSSPGVIASILKEYVVPS